LKNPGTKGSVGTKRNSREKDDSATDRDPGGWNQRRGEIPSIGHGTVEQFGEKEGERMQKGDKGGKRASGNRSPQKARGKDQPLKNRPAKKSSGKEGF